jgi:hypothetical protein
MGVVSDAESGRRRSVEVRMRTWPARYNHDYNCSGHGLDGLEVFYLHGHVRYLMEPATGVRVSYLVLLHNTDTDGDRERTNTG